LVIFEPIIDYQPFDTMKSKDHSKNDFSPGVLASHRV